MNRLNLFIVSYTFEPCNPDLMQIVFSTTTFGSNCIAVYTPIKQLIHTRCPILNIQECTSFKPLKN